MRQILLIIALLCPIAACAVAPQVKFEPSKKSAVELRAMQVRTVAADSDTTMRAVIATIHDLGYRITRVEPDARTISATRQTTLRMAVVVQPRGPSSSTVRTNASVVALGREAQVDSPEFYQKNFFEPLGATMGRALETAPSDLAAPDAPRPVAELNSTKEREAAAKLKGEADQPTDTAKPGVAPQSSPSVGAGKPSS